MIFISDPLMTLIDVIIVASVLTAYLLSWRHQAFRISRNRQFLPTVLALAGLACIGVVHLADLLGMHLVYHLYGQAARQAWQYQLHGNVTWIVWPIALALMAAAVLLGVLRQKHFARDLQVSEARFESIVDVQRDLIARWTADGRCTWFNARFAEAHGIEAGPGDGSHPFTMLSRYEREHIFKSIGHSSDQAFATSSKIEPVPGGTAQSCWIEWLHSAVRDANNGVVEVQSIGRDITERVLAEVALQESEHRFRRFVENTSDWVWEINSAGYCTYSNSVVQDLLGYAPRAIVGEHWEALTHPDDLDCARQTMSDCLVGEQGWQRMLVRLRHADGSYRYLESTADPIFNAAGKLQGFQGIDRDVTFDTLMTRVSEHLVGRSSAELDTQIESALKEIGQCYGLDRITLWWHDGPYARPSHQWTASGEPTALQPIDLDEVLPEAARLLNSGKSFRVSCLDDIARMPAEARFLELRQIKSMLILPLMNDAEMAGMAVFSMLSAERNWSPRVESDLSHISERIISAYSLSRWAQAACRREEDLAQCEALAGMGSFSLYPYREDSRYPDEWHAEFSKELCCLFNVHPDEASMDTFRERVLEADRDHVSRVFSELFQGANDVSIRFRVQGAFGVRHMLSRCRVDRDRDGRNVRVIGAVLDVTVPVERESSLKSALAEIETLKDRLEEENTRLREEVRAVTTFEQIVGESEPMRRCLEFVARIAPTDAEVLILGETGTGKELVARAIHNLSARSEKKLVCINCAALPADLMESELFGHEKGAFTGANSSRLGQFEFADGGTLFLDEIGDLPLPLQGKLLRVLQDGSFYRVGSSELRHTNVRIIAATNCDLEEAVQAGKFRADLYYRINTVQVDLPPLRERAADIPLLAKHFIDKHGAKSGNRVRFISNALLQHLQEQQWPGNVRELEHVIERGLISERSSVLRLSSLEIPGRSFGRRASDLQITSTDLRAVEKNHIEKVLEEASWTISGKEGAAARLNINPSTLRSKMKRLGIERRN